MNEPIKYNLEERCFKFAKEIAIYSKSLPRNLENIEYLRQLIKSSGSIGANYIEANESLSKRDFTMRIKISRKEAKETVFWIRLLIETNEPKFTTEGSRLEREATELKKIFSSIIEKTK